MKIYVTEDVIRHLVIKSKFSIANDKALVDSGSHFFCQGHLSAVPLEKQKNKEYCVECYAIMREL